MSATQGFPLLVDEFQQVMARIAVQLAEAPEQVVALQTPEQRALDILAPHLADEPLYHPHA